MANEDRQTDFGWTVDLMPRQNPEQEPAKAARDEAVERAGEAADAEGWLDKALETIRSVALAKHEFTADDIWQSGLEPPRESRALGAAFTKVQREGLIEATTSFKSTTRTSRHAAPIRVWRSLIKSNA